MNATSPKTSLSKLGILPKQPKPFKVMVLGQHGVGKTGTCFFSSFFCSLKFNFDVKYLIEIKPIRLMVQSKGQGFCFSEIRGLALFTNLFH